MTLSVGQTVGDYRVVGVIGSGGMGTVYKVQHVISDRIEAMKVILPSLVESPQLAERFMREIKVQARLQHPNIASLHNALRLDNGLLMVMEYVEGISLHARLRTSVVDVGQSLDIAVQTLSALSYAHGQGVVHRDIKPANIMITPDGTVKLMDFGIARAADHEDHLTRTGAAIGSLYYMSPEQVQGGTVDQRSDLYSFGITLYEMLTGTKPITGETSFAIMSGHLSQTPLSPGTVNPRVNASLSLAVLKSIEKRPEDRFQNAHEFATVLQMIRTRTPSGATPAPETIAMPEPAAAPKPERERPVTPPSFESLPRQTPAPANTPVTPAEAKPTVTPTPPSGTLSNAQRFDPADLDRARKALASYVGPMAKILVDRAARKSTSLQQLYELLAAEVPEGQERKQFLNTRPR